MTYAIFLPDELEFVEGETVRVEAKDGELVFEKAGEPAVAAA